MDAKVLIEVLHSPFREAIPNVFRKVVNVFLKPLGRYLSHTTIEVGANPVKIDTENQTLQWAVFFSLRPSKARGAR
jgi:hypothetical protein